MRYRNKLVYDNTGEIRDDKKFMSMMEDFWLPRREGRGTAPLGGQNLGGPISTLPEEVIQSTQRLETRIQGDTGFSMGRSSEILRDEVKFSKFVGRPRKRFSDMFNDMLKTQLTENVVTPEDWEIASIFCMISCMTTNLLNQRRNLPQKELIGRTA